MLRRLFFVQLPVRDWQRSLRWYGEHLGLQVSHRDDRTRWALLRFPGGGAGIALSEAAAPAAAGPAAAGPAAPGAGGGMNITIEVDDLDVVLARLAERGIRPEQPVELSPEGYRLARLRDPDGHRLHLFDWAAGRRPAGEG